jgi:hypothetical protein
MAKKENPYYSKGNPLGPYESTHRPGAPSREEYIEGESTKGNLKAWANYASKNSGPKIAPGLDGKGGNRRGE